MRRAVHGNAAPHLCAGGRRRYRDRDGGGTTGQRVPGGRDHEVGLVRQDVLRPGLLVDINNLPLTGVEDLPGSGLLIGWTKAAPHADRWAAWKSDTRSTAGTLPESQRSCQR